MQTPIEWLSAEPAQLPCGQTTGGGVTRFKTRQERLYCRGEAVLPGWPPPP